MKLGDVYVEVKGDTKKVQTDLGKLKKTSDATSKSMTASWKKVGVAMFAVAAAATAAFVASKKAFGAIKNIAEMGDKFHKMSLRVGETAEALSALEYAANISGTSIETVEKGLKYLTQQMNDFQDGTGEAAKTFEALGIVVTDADGRLRMPIDTMKDIADKLAGMDNASQQAAYAMELFGSRAGTQLLPMLKLGSAGIEDLMKRAEELGLVVSTEFAGKSAAFIDALRDWKGAIDGIKMAIIEGLLPQITDVVLATTEWVVQNKELIKIKVERWVKGVTIAAQALVIALKAVVLWAGIVLAILGVKLVIAAGAAVIKLGSFLAILRLIFIRMKALAGIGWAVRAVIAAIGRAVVVAAKEVSKWIPGILAAAYALKELYELYKKITKVPEEPMGVLPWLDRKYLMGGEEELRILKAIEAVRINIGSLLPRETWIETGGIRIEPRGKTPFEMAEDWVRLNEVIKNVWRGVKAGRDEFAAAWQDVDNMMQRITATSLYDFSTGIADAFMDFASGAKSAKEAFSEFARSFINDISRMIMRQLVLNAISGFFPTVAPAPAPTPVVIPAGMQHGGIARGPSTGYPVTLHGTEEITPLGPGGQPRVGRGDVYNININAVDAKSFAELCARNPDALISPLRRNAIRGGPMRGSIRGTR